MLARVAGPGPFDPPFSLPATLLALGALAACVAAVAILVLGAPCFLYGMAVGKRRATA